MGFLGDRRFLFALGGGVLTLVVSLALAWAIMNREHRSTAPPPASTGGLVVQAGPSAPGAVDPGQPLRCFVSGQFVGSMNLSDCASRNGVATDALDVGVDPSGALGAGAAGAQLAPLPPPSAAAPEAAASAQLAQTQTTGPVGDCLRYSGSSWRKVGGELGLSACVQALFAGHCEAAGGASYGHWMNQTVRLVPHRVEISADNRSFRPLVEQIDQGCAIPAF